MKRLIFLGLALLALCGSGCASIAKPQTEAIQETAPTETTNPFVKTLGPGLEKITFHFGSSTREYLSVYKIDPSVYTFSIEHATSGMSIANWQEDLPDAVLIANGSYFLENQRPAGLLIAHGKTVQSEKFDLAKSALLNLSPRPRIIDTAVEMIPKQMEDALQSYPLLIRAGAPAVKADSRKLARRTFFGTDSEGNTYLGILPDTQLSLFSLSHELARMPIDWDLVLNLDGGPSSGIADMNGVENSQAPVPNVVVVKKKSP